MTLTADHASVPHSDDAERRGRAIEPRRSWASPQPFVARRTRFNSNPELEARTWRSRGHRYAEVALSVDFVLALGMGVAALAPTFAPATAFGLAVVGALVFVGLVGAFHGYRAASLGDGPAEFQAVGRAALTSAVLLMVLGYLVGAAVPRLAVLVGVPLLALSSAAVRHRRRQLLHRRRRAGESMMTTIVVGDAAPAARVIRDLTGAPHHGYRVEGVCSAAIDDSDQIADAPILGGVADVVQVAADHAAEVVIVTGTSISGAALRRLSWALGRAGTHLVVAPDLIEVAAPRLTVRPTAGLSLLEVEVDSPRPRLVAKSVIDVVLATIIALAVAPIVALAALLIRATSEGPAFYRQTRVGVDGERFTMWKLRTMFVDADRRRAELADQSDRDGLMFKMKHDPRVTPVGRILRRFSIDELPQLWNVVRGDMSLVGPRPPLECEVDAYEDQVHRRLRVKPGLTGLWQVSGRADLSWDESVRLDLRYVDNWSVSMDLLILWKTGRAVLKASGAY
ncbi:sugar transferase [Cellulomonas sp. DKR-3]|uniref:Sugar transferase n=1 Tax=Cellulomonas fulva TaxID=2835530 RepID=A0ABS5TUR9_9CELL|nr:sugar transferase [Cellulomonas fulva]MBT0992906.1 sugar transferase [Cellulomonas fulva]